MIDLNLIQRFAIWAIPVIFSITVHEVAHGWVARRLGDPTAMMLGRLTLNPIKHIDPIGTILVPGALLMLGGFIFGWAKPVPVTWENLKNPKRDMALVALAGPTANLLMALLWAIVLRLGIMLDSSVTASDGGSAGLFMIYIGVAGVMINTILMVINLLPLPPLDGGRVVTGLLPSPMDWKFSRIEPYGMMILLGLLVTGYLSKIMWPLIALALGLFAGLAGINTQILYRVISILMGN